MYSSTLLPAWSTVAIGSTSRAVLIVWLAAVPARGMATDLGSLGPTYAVAEQSFLAMIDDKLRARAASGELTRLMERAAGNARAAISTPKPVPGVSTCTRARSFFFDPSIALSENIVDSEGHLLFAAGTRKNPLEVVSLSRSLLFFDARDARQRSTAQRLLKERNERIKLILTGGSYLDLMRQWRKPVFYDQQGLLTRRLGIRQVPALVTQEGQRLRIDEMEVTQ